MHALLITGGGKESRRQAVEKKLKEWGIDRHDVVVLVAVESSIGIDLVRAFQKRLMLKPYRSPFTVGVLEDMGALTQEAQNALLKTLEEPPPHARIIGTISSQATLLPTIVSRMHVVPLVSEALTGDDIAQTLHLFHTLKSLSPGKRLLEAENLADSRQAAEQLIEKSLQAIDHTLRHPSKNWPPESLASLGRGLLSARKQLAANVNYRLVLDNLLLTV